MNALALLEHGLPLDDIVDLANDDIRTIPSLVEGVQKIERIKLDKLKLAMAEAFNAAFVGSQPDQSHMNAKAYEKWRNKVVRTINKENGVTETPVIWNSFRKKSRKF